MVSLQTPVFSPSTGLRVNSFEQNKESNYAVPGGASAVAITVTLASLGDPFGMLSGVAVLGILRLISQGLTELQSENRLVD